MLYDRTYGIEIETMVPNTVSGSALAAAITNAGVPCRYLGYTHARTPDWKIVTDGSLRTGHGQSGYEIVSPVLRGEVGHEQIAKVSQALLAIGAVVNKSCGLHVHVDVRGLSVAVLKKLTALYIEHENIIDSLLPASRRGNSNVYCNSLQGTSMQRLAQASNINGICSAIAGGSRYVKLNFQSFTRHGTVEFRHHSGTVDAEKISKWLIACLRFVDTAIKEADQPISEAVSARPTNRRLATIYDLMQRPGGCTRADVANALGRRTMPPMNRILRNAGFTYTIEHRRSWGTSRITRRTERYVLSSQITSGNATATAPVTFETFCEKFGMAEDEKNFWIARRTTLGSNSSLQG